jgi:hypothetical protein
VVLKQLEDQSADVQNLAVKWCARLRKRNTDAAGPFSP